MSDSRPTSEPLSPVRVRFAPSPTGYLHIGGARTALFNYLFARREGGVFVLRVEDTDRRRSTPEAVSAILDGLRYLGLNWDEGPDVGGDLGPYFQSERADSHAACVDRLLERSAAYHCFCSKERLEELRAGQKARKERWKYDRRCLALEPSEVARRLAAGEPSVVRFRVPEGVTVVEDRIRGRVSWSNEDIEDFVIRRADGTCVYNLAVMADDHGMGITHVIRGEDHLTNTPKQILLFEALDRPVPCYAHIPLILGPKGSKLSKRHGAVSVTEYEERGYLPEAMINFLARMGWSFDDKQEIFSREELIEKFSLKGVSKAGAVYDLDKLNHLSGHYMRLRSVEDVMRLAWPYLEGAGFVGVTSSAEDEKLRRIVALAKDRIEHFGQIVEQVRFYFEEPAEPDAGGAKVLRKKRDSLETVKQYTRELEGRFPDGWGVHDDPILEEHARDFIGRAGVALGDLAQPVRVLLTGRSATPGLFEVMAILGKDKCLRRLSRADPWLGRTGG